MPPPYPLITDGYDAYDNFDIGVLYLNVSINKKRPIIIAQSA